MALFIDKSDAFKIFNLLISSTLAKPTAKIELFLMYSERIILFLNEIFLESLMPFAFMLLFNITAAEKTGPAKQPLPTSSTPAIFFTLSKVNYILKVLDFSLIIFKSIHANFFCSG